MFYKYAIATKTMCSWVPAQITVHGKYMEDNKQAVTVLNRFKRGMERLRKSGAQQEKVADLIDSTIQELMSMGE